MSEIEDHKKRLLLISNSTLYGSGYLDHAEKEIADFLGAVRRVLFIPFAQRDRDAYASMARRRLAVRWPGQRRGHIDRAQHLEIPVRNTVDATDRQKPAAHGDTVNRR